MISRTLSERVQKLEERLIPTDEPIVIQIKYVSSDGSVTDGPTYGPSENPSAQPTYGRPPNS